MAQFVIKIEGLKQLQKNFERAPVDVFNSLERAINKSAWIITGHVKDATPVKTHALKSGIRPDFGRLSATIRPHNAPYAFFVHEGTKPHIIKPKVKKALWWKGAAHPVKRVHHPGTKANPFMEKGLEKSITEVEQIFKKEIDSVLIKISKN